MGIIGFLHTAFFLVLLLSKKEHGVLGKALVLIQMLRPLRPRGENKRSTFPLIPRRLGGRSLLSLFLVIQTSG